MHQGILTYKTPFSKEIMDTEDVKKVKVPPIEHFDGTTDPSDHMASYKAQMAVQTGCGASWCK